MRSLDFGTNLRKQDPSTKQMMRCVAALFIILFLVLGLSVPFSRANSLLFGPNSNFSYVKETLFLSNNTLVPGNAPSSSMMVGRNSNPEIHDASNPLSNTLGVGNSPFGIAYDPSNGNLYVANFEPGTVSVINGTTNSVVSTINVNMVISPWETAYNPSNGYVYVTDTEDGNCVRDKRSEQHASHNHYCGQ